jgi:hypothetical protein
MLVQATIRRMLACCVHLMWECNMQSSSLRGLRQEGERLSWHRQYIRNALATIGQIKTEDKTLAEHLLSAEQALRKADAYAAGNRQDEALSRQGKSEP